MGEAASKLNGFIPSRSTCPECGAEFERRTWTHRFCSERCKERDHRRDNPAHVANTRARCARWSESNRGVKARQPWLLGAPPFERHLPGGGLSLSFAPHVTFEHRQLSALHGVVTSLTGAHDRNVPNFALVPWHSGCRWGAFLRDEDAARDLAGTTHDIRLGCSLRKLTFGPLHRVLAPKVTIRGHRRLRIDAITPVCVRCTIGEDGSYRLYTAPTSGNLLSTLTLMTPKRIGLWLDQSTVKLDMVEDGSVESTVEAPADPEMDDDACAEGPQDVRLELIERATQPASVNLLGRQGRLGNMRGWVGHVVVDCNAPAHWLLAVAERIGFGGTTSFGFGRIKVTEL